MFREDNETSSNAVRRGIAFQRVLFPLNVERVRSLGRRELSYLKLL